MEYFSKDMEQLVQELGRLPGIGQKSAQRLAYHIINEEKEIQDNISYQKITNSEILQNEAVKEKIEEDSEKNLEYISW